MCKKLFLFFAVSLVICISTTKAMDVVKSPQEQSFVQENKKFLNLFLQGKKQKQCAQDLQLLLTSLLVQERYFLEIEKGAIESEKGQAIDKKTIDINLQLNDQQILTIKENDKNICVGACNPKTKNGAKVVLLFAEHLGHLCKSTCDLSAIKQYKKNIFDQKSEAFLYLDFILNRQKSLKQTKIYNNTINAVATNTEKLIIEHKSKNINLQNLITLKNSVTEPISNLLICLQEEIDFSSAYNKFAPYKEKLRDLYKQAKEKHESICNEKITTKKNNKGKKNNLKNYLKTLENTPKEFPIILPENSSINWLPKNLIQPKQQNNQKQQKIKIEELEKVYHLHDSLSKTEEKKIITCKDGSYTSLITNNEVVIEYPNLKTTITLYAINTKKYPVNVDLLNLACTNNIVQWKENPQEALEKQGYSNPNHHYFQPLITGQNRMIHIHALPDEIKKHIGKFAQQTECISRKNKEQKDIQITFCGELKYPNGTSETGLFIYLINSKTNNIYHQMFTESSYEKTFKIYLEQGNFNNAFDSIYFPSLSKN